MSRKLCVTICRAFASPYSGAFRLRTPLTPVPTSYYHPIHNDRSSRRRPPKKYRPSASSVPAKKKKEEQRQRQPVELMRPARRVSSAAVHAQPDPDPERFSAEEQVICCASHTTAATAIETETASSAEVEDFKGFSKARIPCTCNVSAADAKSQQQVVVAASAPSSVRRMIFCTCCASLATDSQRDPDLNDGRIVSYAAVAIQGSQSQTRPYKEGRGLFCCASPATHSQRAPKDESIFCSSSPEGDVLALSKLSASLSTLSCIDPAVDALPNCESGRINGCLSLSRASSSSKTVKDHLERKGGAALSKSGLSTVESSQVKPFKRRQLLFRLCRRQQVLPWKSMTTSKDQGSVSLRRKSTITNIAPPLDLLLRNKVL